MLHSVCRRTTSERIEWGKKNADAIQCLTTAVRSTGFSQVTTSKPDISTSDFRLRTPVLVWCGVWCVVRGVWWCVVCGVWCVVWCGVWCRWPGFAVACSVCLRFDDTCWCVAVLRCVNYGGQLSTWPRGVTVSTLDSESSDRGSNPREA